MRRQTPVKVHVTMRRVFATVVAMAAMLGTSAAAGFEPGSWRLVAISGEELPAAGRSTPSFELAMDGRSFSATLGCNMFGGQVTLGATSVEFGPARSTRMACPPPLDRLEPAFAAAIEASTVWIREGDMITIHDNSGVARLILVRTIGP
jgi:heat shock protein HslJ